MLRYGWIGLVLAGMVVFAGGAGAGTISIFGDTISFGANTDVTHTGTGWAWWTWQPTTAGDVISSQYPNKFPLDRGIRHQQPPAQKNWLGSYQDKVYQSGGLYFDIIAIYARPSSTKLDFGVVISMDPYGIKEPWYGSGWLGPGDLKVNITPKGSTTTDIYGVGLRPTQIGTDPYAEGYWLGKEVKNESDINKTDNRPAISKGKVKKNPDFYRYDGIDDKFDGMTCWTMDPDSGLGDVGTALLTKDWTYAGTIDLGDDNFQKRDIWYAQGEWDWSSVIPQYGDTFEADIYFGLDCNNDAIKVKVRKKGGQFEQVPESSTLALFGLGALGLLIGRKRKA